MSGFCAICSTPHGSSEPCPGELRATGPERHGWAVAVDAPRGVELYGVIVAPSAPRWRARVVTYPKAPWTIPETRGPLRFVGDSPGEAEARALEFVLQWCAAHGKKARDGFGPWDLPDGPPTRKLPPRKRRQIAVRYATPSSRGLTTTANVSPTGMFLTAIDPLPVGTVVDLEMEIFGCVAAFRGEVRWIREALEPGRPRGMGVRLYDPPPVYKLFVRGLT